MGNAGDVAGPATVTAAFAPEPHSAGAARRFVATTLAAWGLPEAVEVACLLTSELVANAVLHARTPLRLVLATVDRSIRVEVHDLSPLVAAPRPLGSNSMSGRGLHMVDRLSDAWGMAPEGGGKQVWFALSA